MQIKNNKNPKKFKISLKIIYIYFIFLTKMSKDFNFSISSNKDLFSDEIQESLYDSVFPDNLIMNLEEPTYESLLSLLIETNRNTKENIKKTTSDESSSNRVQFLVEKKFINKKRGRKAKGKIHRCNSFRKLWFSFL